MNKVNHVIVSERPWNRLMADRLESGCADDFTLINRREDLTEARLASLQPRYVFFPHWSYKIPAAIYQGYECVIFHMTDLPYGRGGSPLQNLIVRGYTETVITALRCEQEMDAGPVYMKRPLSLLGTAEEIFIRASGIIEDMILDIIDRSPEPVPQEGDPVIFTRRRPEDGDLRNTKSLNEFYDFVRMLDAEGYPPAFIDIGHFRFEFSRASRRSGSVEADVRITTIREKDDE